MTKSFFNPENKTAKELTNAKYNQKKYFQNSQKGWYEDYMNSRAQYQMTFIEYKKLRKNKTKYDKWLKDNT
jgi:hypothetical protein